MTVILAEGWKTYADRTEIPFGYPLWASITSNAAFADISGRRTADLYGSKVARAFAPGRRVCGHFIVDLTAGSIGSTTLFMVGLNPANVATAAYTDVLGDRFRLEAYGANLRVIRQAFNPDGSLNVTTQTVASVAHGWTAGTSYRVEFVVDVSGSTGFVEVMVNGMAVISTTFSRAISSFACDADFGIVSLYAQSTSNCRGRISNFVLYSDSGNTAWPAGPLNISYLPAQANSGETITWPPAATDPEIPVTDATGKTWALADLTGVTSSAIKAVIGSVRMSAPDALIPANAVIQFKDGSTVLASSTQQIQPGAPVFDRRVTIPISDPAVLNNMTLTIKQA